MAILKQIKFGNQSTPIAMTQVAINADSDKVLSVVPTHTDLNDVNDPLYTLALAVDGKTITKTGENGLATSLKLSYHAAVTTEGSAKGAYIALEDNTGASIANSEIPVQDIIGNGILKNSAYDPSTGILTLTFDSASGKDTKVEIDLSALFDFEDIVIKDNSTQYLGFEKTVGGTDDTKQAQFEAKVAAVTGSETNLSVDTANGSLLDASQTITAVKTYVDGQVKNLAVSAEGDAYITAAVDGQNNKKINVSADVQYLTASAGTVGVYDANGKETTAPAKGSLSGTANSLVDGADVAEKVKTYVEGAVAIEAARADAKVLAAVNALDATVGSTTVENGNHVAVQVVETDGKLTGLTVTEKDIASKAALDAEIAARETAGNKLTQDLADEVTRAKAAEKEIADKVGLTGVEGSRTFVPTTNYGGAATSVMDNMQKLDTKLNEVAGKLAGVQYKVSGTTLEFFGITENKA